MQNMPDTDLVWVANPDRFKKMIDDLSGCTRIAVDTESNSLYVYREQVCLIQFSTGKADYLLDPLAIKDLSSLGPVFANGKIEKIFHAAEYDLICLKRDFGFEFVNLFDTMQAARILGRPNVGLASMLESEFNIRLQKKFQRANWGKRPLPEEMLRYARLDSYFLIPLRDKLKEELMRAGRWELAEEDFRRTTNVSLPNHDNGANICWRVAGNHKLNPVQLSVLQELCRFREQRAQSANLPSFKILGNQTLLDMTLAMPHTNRDLQSIRSLNENKIKRYGEGLLRAVERGQGVKPFNRPDRNRPSDAYLARLENLRQWRMRAARRLNVESDVILPKDVMEGIAMQQPSSTQGLREIMADVPWRFDQFGAQILQVIASREGQR